MPDLNNPDVDLLRWINGVAPRIPEGAEGIVTFLGEFGIPAALLLLVVLAWWMVRRGAGATQAVAGVIWAPLAAGAAYLINAPIREFVARPRPSLEHVDIHVLLDGKTGYSFVSDHAAAAMVLAVALFLVHRKIGALALGLAVLQGGARVLMGLHYPTDVIGGFALGMAVALLFAPLALWTLTPLTTACSRTRGLRWVAIPAAPAAPEHPEHDEAEGTARPVREEEPARGRGRHRARAEKDLAA